MSDEMEKNTTKYDSVNSTERCFYDAAMEKHGIFTFHTHTHAWCYEYC